uniref:Putative 5.3 kDa protein n=1 Tax=Ixodes ricinus TaxID=34613 RepID=A0A0K8RH92_IXORI
MRVLTIVMASLLLLESLYSVEGAPGRRPPYTKGTVCRQPCDIKSPHCKKPCPHCKGGIWKAYVCDY